MMMMMNDDLYDALLIAGVPEAKARAAAAESVIANETMQFVKEVFDEQEHYWREQVRRTRRLFVLMSVIVGLQMLDIALSAYRFFIIGAAL